jgi:hypothetical protein
MPADLELAAQAEHDLAEAAGIGDRGAFRGDHHHVHDALTPPFGEAEPLGDRRCRWLGPGRY